MNKNLEIDSLSKHLLKDIGFNNDLIGKINLDKILLGLEIKYLLPNFLNLIEIEKE